MRRTTQETTQETTRTHYALILCLSLLTACQASGDFTIDASAHDDVNLRETPRDVNDARERAGLDHIVELFEVSERAPIDHHVNRLEDLDLEDLDLEDLKRAPEREDEERLSRFPDALQCASESTFHEINVKTIRMEIQDVYGLAFTQFELGHLHDTEFTDITEVLDRAVYNSLPDLRDDLINLDFTARDLALGEADSNDHFFGGDAHLSLSRSNELFTGVLTSPRFGELEMHCWTFSWGAHDELNPHSHERVYSKEFRYNERTGQCENEAGEEGFNHSSVVRVRETGDGECVDMSDWVLDEEHYGHQNLDWDIRGALMDGAQLHFADFIGVDFSGVDMQGLEYGYARLDGVIDDFTVLPQNCEANGDEIRCIQ